ncbi:MAG: 16S rRNA (guanine(966)-N(2))-methyltransferase RsmD [Burkholderiales bacterium]|nr:16S rRNA (guanine(966)-N(2))-methyltransferase RsmD [Burkholderiales bacterium]
MSEGRAREVRLIGGQWKRSRLPVADRPGLRPSPDRVRETLFNWLGQSLPGWRVLDAFAGSGALGFEAASRGAAEVLLLERDPALVRSLQQSKARLGAATLQVQRADALAWMATGPRAHFQLVFLDPPFDAGVHAQAIACAMPLLTDGGFLYVESGQALPDPPQGMEPFRQGRAGAVHHGLWRRRYTAPAASRGTSP